MRIPNANQLLRLLALLTLLAAGLFGALSLRAPIDDPDLWWHLAAGEQLLRDRALPAEDSFTHTWSGESSSRLRVILTSSWLSELLFQLVFRCCSWQGLLLLRVLIVLSLVASLVWRMWAERTAPALAVSVLGLGLIAFFGCYRLDRPQLLSFLFASLLLALLERVRRGHPPSWWLLPLMLLWSNAHGGYVFGVAVLVLFGLGTALQFRSDRPRVLRLLG